MSPLGLIFLSIALLTPEGEFCGLAVSQYPMWTRAQSVYITKILDMSR